MNVRTETKVMSLFDNNMNINLIPETFSIINGFFF